MLSMLTQKDSTKKCASTEIYIYLSIYIYIKRISYLLFLSVPLICTGTVFVCIDKTWNVIGSNGNNKGIGDDSQNSNSFQNPIPDT